MNFVKPGPKPRGHSNMSVDIKYLSIKPPFLRRSYTQWPPFFLSPHTLNDPLFPLSCQILHTKWKFLGASRAFWEIYQFWGNFDIKFTNFGLKLHFCTLNDAFLHTKWPRFGGFDIKKDLFFQPTSNDPFFQRNLTQSAPYFRSPLGTCTSLLYSRAPPPTKVYKKKKKRARVRERESYKNRLN